MRDARYSNLVGEGLQETGNQEENKGGEQTVRNNNKLEKGNTTLVSHMG